MILAVAVTAQESVQIGTQVWMKQNLNVGTMISGGVPQANNGTVEKYCYDNIESNCAIYGGLYQWDEAMQYATAPQGICPNGWHIPTVEDYQTLYEYLGGANSGFPLPANTAGKAIKETGAAHWKILYRAPVYADNSTGFAALGSGVAWHNGRFYYIKMDFNMWLSSKSPAGNPYWGGATYATTNLNFGEFYKAEGLSIRCIHD